MPTIFQSFRARILLFVIVLLFTVQTLTFVAVYNVTRRNVTNQIRLQLLDTSRSFLRDSNERTQLLSQQARILSSDYGFRQAVASNDTPTILSALVNLNQRSEKDRALLISLDGQILIDTRHGVIRREKFNYPSLMEEAEKKGAAASNIVRDGTVFEFVLVPVLAPVPIAWIGIGEKIDDRFLGRLKRHSAFPVDITYVAKSGNGGLKPLASTLSVEHQHELSQTVSTETLKNDQPTTLRLGKESFISLSRPLSVPGEAAGINAVFQYSFDTAMEPYRSLLLWLVVLFTSALVLSLIIGVAISGGVTKPVKILSEAAARIRKGVYTQPVALSRKDELGQLADGFNHMMKGIAQREKKIVYQAHHDDVTGLSNRFFFQQVLEKTIARHQAEPQTFAVILMGVDRFANINFTLGHNVGDRLLGAIGKRIQNRLGSSISIARFSTAEFIVLFPDKSPEDAEALARSLLDLFETPFSLDEINIDVVVHLGIACFPEDGAIARELMQRADFALFDARDSGRDYARYNPAKDSNSLQKLSLMGELRKGIEKNEIVLYYQPKIDLNLNRTTHTEALVRWNHPKRGLLPPVAFVPMAENTGHIRHLTRFVIREAIAQSRKWLDRGIDLKISVNFSVKDLLDRDLPEYLLDLLDNNRIGAKQIVLEITESAIMKDPRYSLNVLERFKGMGFELTVDDFGTGYSSMAYLKQLPVDEIKVDKSFVIGLSKSPEDEIIVRSTIGMGHHLGLRVVAEGVEDASAIDILKRDGCDMCQGYYFSPPLPVEKFEHWLITSPWGLDGAVFQIDGKQEAKQ